MVLIQIPMKNIVYSFDWLIYWAESWGKTVEKGEKQDYKSKFWNSRVTSWKFDQN